MSAAARQAAIAVSAVVLAFVLTYLVIGFATLDATTRFVPLLAGGVTLLLVAIDLYRLSQGHGESIIGAQEGGGVAEVKPVRELLAILYVAGGVALIYLLGFLIGIPVYLFTSIAYLGRQSKKTAAVVALITSALIYLLFEVALSYDLHAGILFT